MTKDIKGFNLKKMLLPSSILGKKTLWLTLSFVIFFSLFWFFVKLGFRGGDTLFSQPVLTIPMFIAAFSAIAAFFTGLTSVIKEKERSFLVYISTIWGAFVIFFILGEIFSPH